MKPLRIVIAEDHTLVRAGLRVLLQSLDDIEVVAEAGNGREAVRLAKEHLPDIVLMDITMKDLNGLGATARIVKDCPRTRVIILSMHADPIYVRQALQAGAAGYLIKGADVPELKLALEAAARGETYLTPAASKDIISDMRHGRLPPADPLDRLTPRQREVLQLLAEGSSTKAIAGKLDLSVKTVETHRGEIMERLDIHDVPGLVRFAIRSGLIQTD